MNAYVDGVNKNIEKDVEVIDKDKSESRRGSTDNELHSSARLKKGLIFLAVIAFLLVVGVLVTYFNNFNGELSKSSADWGSFGDFVGGSLNPLLAFLSFVALLITLVMQSQQLELSRKELSETKEELRRAAEAQEESHKALVLQNKTQTMQQFENTFFSIVHQLNIIGEPVGSLKGGVCFSDSERALHACINSINDMHTHQSVIYLDDCQRVIVEDLPIVNQYFKVLYQALKFIEGGELFVRGKIYSNLVRSMVPDHLLALLWIHCAVPEEHPFYKFKLLLEKYSFFEHLYWDSYFYGYSEAFNDALVEYYRPDAYDKSIFVRHPAIS